jgi:hypothetical protein
MNGKTIRGWSLAALGFVILALIGANLDYAAEEWNWNQGLVKAIDFVAPVFDSIWFWPVIYLSIGAIGGVWLHFFSARKQAAAAVATSHLPANSPTLAIAVEKLPPAQPDIGIVELGKRIVRIKGPLPAGKVALEVLDNVKPHGLTVWGRLGSKARSTISADELERAEFQIGPWNLRIVSGYGQAYEYKDVQFIRAEVDQVWPPEPEVTRRDKLGTALNVGTHLYQERLDDRDKYANWKERLDAWVQSTGELLKNEYTNAEAQLFLMLPSVSAAWVGGSISQEHSFERLHLDSRLKAVRKTMETIPK